MDQFHQRAAIYMGATDDDLCPIMQYVAVRGNMPGPFFPFQRLYRILEREVLVALWKKWTTLTSGKHPTHKLIGR